VLTTNVRVKENVLKGRILVVVFLCSSVVLGDEVLDIIE
jgi:hypothetical protein